jgi:hypothetical protein
MKKTLLILLSAVFLITVSYAQVGLKYQSVFDKFEYVRDVTPGVFKPYLKARMSSVTENKEPDNVVGTTMFDVQSYGGIPRHIWVWNDGSIGIAWTRGMESGNGYPDRGTGYNYYNGSVWGSVPTTRIENARTGWPVIQPYGENGEIVCAHAYPAGTILFSYRDERGTGNWNYFEQVSPVDDAALVWPRMVTTGNDHKTIHLITMVGWGGYEYEGLKMALTYSRTNDGGQTWDPNMEIIDGMTSDDYFGIGADNYGWAVPRGDTIAFVVFDGIRDGFIMKSYDAGETWEKVTFYESPDNFFDGNAGDMPKCGGGDGSNAIAIDKDGMVHVAFGRQLHVDDTPDDDTYSYYPYSDGLVYWNESMPPLDTSDIASVVITSDWSSLPIYQHGQLATYTRFTNENDTIIGLAPYYSSLTSMPQIEITEDARGKEIVTIFYSGIALGYVNDELSQNYRHIFKVQSELDGKWSEPEDLTGDVFHIASECVFPSTMAKNGTFHMTYQTDNLPGLAAYSNHSPVVNNIVYLPVTPLPVGVKENIVNEFEVAQNIPNPAQDFTRINVKALKGEVVLYVMNALGQVVHVENKMSNGTGGVQFMLNVADFAKGVYLYTVKAGGNSVTRKMVVR